MMPTDANDDNEMITDQDNDTDYSNDYDKHDYNDNYDYLNNDDDDDVASAFFILAFDGENMTITKMRKNDEKQLRWWSQTW